MSKNTKILTIIYFDHSCTFNSFKSHFLPWGVANPAGLYPFGIQSLQGSSTFESCSFVVHLKGDRLKNPRTTYFLKSFGGLMYLLFGRFLLAFFIYWPFCGNAFHRRLAKTHVNTDKIKIHILMLIQDVQSFFTTLHIIILAACFMSVLDKRASKWLQPECVVIEK